MVSKGIKVEKTHRSRTWLNKKVALAIIGTSMVWFLVDVVAINMYAGYESAMNSKLPLEERDVSRRNVEPQDYRDVLAENLPSNNSNKMVRKENASASKNRLQRPKLERLLNRKNKEDIRNLTDFKAKVENATKSLPIIEITNSSFHFIQNLDVTTAPRNTSGPGEGGAYIATREEDKQVVQEKWKHNYFNEFASDMISFERSLIDYRPKGCSELRISNDLPKTTVIICFCEESWSTLLRTVHSVINRSPPEILEEILLIDDFSQRDHLKKPLDEYMKKFPKVKIIRLKERYGLIRARLVGVKLAKSSVVTFLDSHVECSVGWLEPLLQRIKEDRRNVVCPVIDRINPHTFGQEEGALSMGSFDWTFTFHWAPLPDSERNRRKYPTSPFRSPTMAGGLFSIDKSFFHELGDYDEGFEVWGGENLELSFKLWMCGGQLEFLPCSRVAHVFRSQQPYSFPGNDNQGTFHRNTMRLVEVWVDEPYKQLFYNNFPEMVGKDPGNLTARRALREKLQCKDFQWYLDNVNPSLKIPDLKFQAKGEVRSKSMPNLCLDNMKANTVAAFQCHGKGVSQIFFLTWRNTLENEGYCCSLINDKLTRVKCEDNKSTFVHEKGGAIKENVTGKCLEINTNDHTLSFQPCNSSHQQKWLWQNYYDKDGGLLK